MKIAHVVTYISEDGAFGGPVAVAVAQTTELARRGHEVELLAGSDGKARLEIPGVAVKLFPVSALPVGGFSGLRSPRLLAYLKSNAQDFDAVHVHLARDLITLPAANLVRKSGVRYIAQPHGMVIRDNRLKARVFDRFATRRALNGAAAIFALTEREERELTSVAAGPASIKRLPNGISEYTPGTPRTDPDKERPEVLFLARLHPRKRVMAFAQMAKIVTDRGLEADFTVIGPDEGDLADLRTFIGSPGAPRTLHYEGTVRQGGARERMSRADVYVLPAFAEVFPMTVLESLSAGVPVVTTTDCDIAAQLADIGAAQVTDGSPEALADAVSFLIQSEDVRRQAVTEGLRAITEIYSIGRVVERLEAAYIDQGVEVR